MEKINLVEILKDCPIGTKLYSPLCGECKLDTVTCKSILVESITFKTLHFNEDGTYYEGYDDAECLLFPSKDQRDWSKFQRPFKDGDIITCTNSACSFVAIFKEMNTDTTFRRYVSLTLDDVQQFWIKESYSDFCNPRLATEEEKQRLFDAIKANGYKWNPETNTLEKLPKFKVGNRIKLKNTPTNNILTVTKTNDDGSLNVNMYSWVITYELQDKYELVPNNHPKFKVGNKIKKKGDARLISIKDVRGDYYIITMPDYFDNCYITDKLSFSNQDEYELVPNKFDITTLKPFDKVLVRDNDDESWEICLFGHCDESEFYQYKCINGCVYAQCIPYEGNEHLLGTTNDCNEYYKNW